MTWTKPSSLWMMYRCGYAQKEGQERVLAVRITREVHAAVRAGDDDARALLPVARPYAVSER